MTYVKMGVTHTQTEAFTTGHWKTFSTDTDDSQLPRTERFKKVVRDGRCKGSAAWCARQALVSTLRHNHPELRIICVVGHEKHLPTFAKKQQEA